MSTAATDKKSITFTFLGADEKQCQVKIVHEDFQRACEVISNSVSLCEKKMNAFSLLRVEEFRNGEERFTTDIAIRSIESLFYAIGVHGERNILKIRTVSGQNYLFSEESPQLYKATDEHQ